MLIGSKLVPMIGLVGVESVGKSTLALLLTGRLRTHGTHAVLVGETGSSLPFPPAMHDTTWQAWVHNITSKIAAECAASMRPNTQVVVSDRTPLDHLSYFEVRRPHDAGQSNARPFVEAWMANYAATYYLPAAGTTYVEDNYRAPVESNTWREKVDLAMRANVEALQRRGLPAYIVEGTTARERSEWVYHHVLSWLLGKGKAAHVYKQVREWFEGRGVRVVSVRPQGSNSLVRFHPASDKDDYDLQVVVTDIEVAARAQIDFNENRAWLESMVQGDLDITVVPMGLESFEV